MSSNSADGARRNTILSLDGMSISLGQRGTARPLVTGVDLAIGQGEIVGLVGESGSGKSISALSCLGLLPAGLHVSSGSISLNGTDVTHGSDEEWRRLRGREVAMIFQDPMTSLDPCFRVGTQIVEAIRTHEDVSKQVASRRAVDMLGAAGIPDAAQRFDAFPHELSGGLRQRVMIAAALALEPSVLIADEPTTALDVTTQASIIELVKGLCQESAMSVLWITHDLGVVAEIAERVAVMYAGELVEVGPVNEVFERTSHHYTMGLLESARYRPHGERFGHMSGAVPEPTEWPSGCRFSPRCPAVDASCTTHPEISSPVDGHSLRCHHPLEVLSHD
jgi:peptide/nickel transport system ATP-binding protein